ncbi:MAG TPA: type II secretion system protein GspN [Kofleriaceae bacterium]|nr:type II secretion system protein GspN [Kofleriaceae bacterium]
MRNAAVLAITLLAACGRTAEPQQGAFEPDDAVQTTSSEVRIAVDRRAVPLEDMLMSRWLAGVPMRGMANVKIDLAAPVKNDRTLYSRAHGTFSLACDKDCQLGDDAARLEVFGQKLDVGHVDIDSLAIRGTVANGHAKLEQWHLVSPDVKIAVDADITLADDFASSQVEGCIRFAPVAGLDKRRPTTWTLLQTTGANADQSGAFSIRITGTLGAPKRLAQECGGTKLASTST